jgi:hypothetical protein
LNAKYESDKQRWMLLKTGKLAVGTVAAPAPEAPRAPAPAASAKGGKSGY